MCGEEDYEQFSSNELVIQTVTITFYEDSIFYFDIASESKDHRTRSTALANLLFTQRARYHPAEGEMADL